MLEDKLEPLMVGRGETLRASVEAASFLQILKLDLLPGAVTRSLREEVDMPYESRDEAYTLSIPGSSLATLTANSTLGLLRGLQTFSQLVYVLPVTRDQTRFIQATPLEITDKPAFPHR